MPESQSGRKKVCHIAITAVGIIDLVVDRKPVDPPPIIQLRISPEQDRNQNYLQSALFLLVIKHAIDLIVDAQVLIFLCRVVFYQNRTTPSFQVLQDLLDLRWRVPWYRHSIA